MKKILALMLTMLLTLSLSACGGTAAPVPTPEPTSATIPTATPEPTPTEPPAPEKITETELVSIDAICVDDSWRDSDESPLRMVYLLYTLTAADSNLKIDSKFTKMTINGKNTYESDNYASSAAAAKFMPNYYYGSYIKDVYIGTSMKVAATFMIPEGDLDAGRSIMLSDDQIPGINVLLLSTDDIQYFSSNEELAAAMDSEGYAQMLVAREEADDETASLIKNAINGCYWLFYVNDTSYKIEFWADNNFVLETAFVTNGGTYSVRNGYIFCTYDSNGHVVEIPYEIVDGDVDLDVVEGFSVF